MILLLGNNEWTRHDIYLSLFIKKHLVSEQRLEDMDYLTKPYITVYINPTLTEINKIKNENTISIIAKNNITAKVPSWMRVIPLDNSTPKRIMEIYEENRTFDKGREVIGILGLEGKLFAMGGAYIRMTQKQLKIIRFLLYNAGKRFSSYDISNYFEFNGDREACFHQQVDDINYRCKRQYKEKLILYQDDKYFISPTVLEY